MELRLANVDDYPQIYEIYSYYVANTAVTFEYEIPPFAEFVQRLEHITATYPLVVASDPLTQQVWGYAYASRFRPRAAYDWSVETSVYLAQDMRRSGIGHQLYTALEELLKLQNVFNLNACIGVPEVEDEFLTNASVRFHEKMGYNFVGRFTNAGYKYGNWYHVVWMEKILAPHPVKPAPLQSFPTVRLVAEQILAQLNS